MERKLKKDRKWLDIENGPWYNITIKGKENKELYRCDQCGHEQEGWGYADGFFYGTVMPNAICPKCGRNSHGEDEGQLEARMGRTFVLDLR